MLLTPFIFLMGDLEIDVLPLFAGVLCGVFFLVSGWKRNSFTWSGIWVNNGLQELTYSRRLRLYIEFFFFAQVLTVPITAFVPIPGISFEVLFAAVPTFGVLLGIWNRGILLPYRKEDL